MKTLKELEEQLSKDITYIRLCTRYPESERFDAALHSYTITLRQICLTDAKDLILNSLPKLEGGDAI